jgi:hypothetical protein
MTINTTLFPALIMAAITALAFIAYYHPKAYSTIYERFIGPLLGISAGVIIVRLIFHLGYMIGFEDSKYKVDDLNKVDLKLPDTPDIPFVEIIVFVLVLAYTTTLYFLHDLGISPYQKEKSDPKGEVKKKNTKQN